ncbi:MAG: carbamoyltransferase [Candidatus Eisenbacteria bacterium]|nr:carbamoyltransferase [Candidatus Latescibacterota bacterium]MBD3301931.1 carbamoyltransferase [Candidatus Eisenbacteria bacterium]
MRILGITDGQTSGAAVIEDGRVLAAVNEERIVRLKLARGFPWKSIHEVLALSGTDPSRIAGVAVAQRDMELREEVSGWPGWFEAREQDQDLHSTFFQLGARFGHLAPKMPGLRSLYYGLRTPAYRHRRERIRQIVAAEYGITAPVRFFHHHYTHATSAYYTCNFDEALVVSMDGGGDRDSSHVYSVRNGQFEFLNKASAYDSLGNYYAYVTALCGFKAKRHEGKITGLSARGEPRYRDLLNAMIACEDGHLRNNGRVLFNQALEKIRSALPRDWRKEDMAASIQTVAEEVAREYVRYWVEKTGHKNVALSGGLFANVRINEEIHRIPGVEQTFVHPGMSDEGLAVGAAFAYQNALDRAAGRPYTPRELKDVYFGTGYGQHEIAEAVKSSGLEARYLPSQLEEEVAELLSQGKVVARYDGRMEYGPRALGNRSILYQPGDPTVNDWLNELLRRTEFMPFAPATLAEESHKLFHDPDGALDTARFMTITFHCTPWMAERCAGVVHVDGTARPQVVRRDDNPSYYDIIDGYYKRTGVPVIINTSFNIHEEPIVRSPQDAIRAFLDSALDYLAIGDFLIPGPVGSAATRKKWEGKSKWGKAVDSPTSR